MSTPVDQLVDQVAALSTKEDPSNASLSLSNRLELNWADEVEVEVKLADQQANVDSPLHSVKSFEELGLYASCMHRYTE
jgi:hypothetical protein